MGGLQVPGKNYSVGIIFALTNLHSEEFVNQQSYDTIWSRYCISKFEGCRFATTRTSDVLTSYSYI